jgi:hypothetical protein
MIFLVEVVLLIPANMMFAYVVVGFSKVTTDWGFMLFFLVCFLITIGIWAVLAIILAKLVCLFKNAVIRNILTSAIVLGLLYLTTQPVYGGGGHGPMRWGTISNFTKSSGPEYWRQVFPATLLVTALHLLYRWKQLNHQTADGG